MSTEERLPEERQRKTRTSKSKENQARPPRVTMSAGFKLEIPVEFKNDEEYYYRWIADREGRVERARQAYYEHVKDARGNDIVVKHEVDMYLMRLPMEYREEDIALKDSKVVDTLKAEQKLGNGEYIPEGNKAPLQRDSDLLDPLA